MSPDPKPYKLAVKAVIEDDDGRCLLIRRSRESRHFAGQWEWPGGKVDPGEDFPTALVREVSEETGLDVEITGLVGAVHSEMPQIHVILLCMTARIVGGEIRMSEEHEESAWAPWAEFPEWDLAEQNSTLMLDYARARSENR